MLRLAARRLTHRVPGATSILSPSAQLADRLDHFEKEFIELKAFRKAVEASSPAVAQEANRLLKESLKEVKAHSANLENPLTPKEFTELNQFFAKQRAKGIRFENLLYISSMNDLQQHARVVHREYLVRIAQRARHLNSAPYGLALMPGIQQLKKWYQWSFHDMRNTPYPENKDGCYRFDRLVRRVFLRHYNVSSLLSEGMLELADREGWREFTEDLMGTYSDLDDFFQEFCTGRVRLRFLVGNYMYLSTRILNVQKEDYLDYDEEQRTTPIFFGHNPDDFVGQLCKKCSLFTLTKYAINEIQPSYDAEIELKLAGDEALVFPGVPYITYDIIFALLEDAVQSNIDRQELIGTPCEKIEVTLSQLPGNKRYSLRVSDTAGGIPLSETAKLVSCWSMYKKYEGHEGEPMKTWTCSPIRLPYAACAAKVIGGDVSVASIEGYGTDRQMYLPSTGITGLYI